MLGNVLTIFSFLVYALIIVTLYTYYAVLNHHSSSDLFGFVMLIVFMTYTMIPLTLRMSTTLNVTFSIFHIIITAVLADESQSDVVGSKVSGICNYMSISLYCCACVLQVGANILLLFATHVLCICYFYISEIGLRKIFCETKTVVLSQLTIQKQVQKRVS